MILVKVRSDSIKAVGHAYYAPVGQDIVCAGATTLIQTLIDSIYKLTNDRPKYILEPGEFKMEIKDLSERSKLLIDSFFIGICLIVDEFPEHISIV